VFWEGVEGVGESDIDAEELKDAEDAEVDVEELKDLRKRT
jgi:hypothetical protein